MRVGAPVTLLFIAEAQNEIISEGCRRLPAGQLCPCTYFTVPASFGSATTQQAGEQRDDHVARTVAPRRGTLRGAGRGLRPATVRATFYLIHSLLDCPTFKEILCNFLNVGQSERLCNFLDVGRRALLRLHPPCGPRRGNRTSAQSKPDADHW